MHTCSEMPYHIGVLLKLHLSETGKRLVAVNDGAQRSVYNHLIACNNEIYRLKKTAAYVPSDRKRIDYLYSVSATAAAIKNALPYLYEKDVDCQTVENGIRNYRIAWKNRKERHTGVPAFHKKSAEQVWQTNCHYNAQSTGLSNGTVRFTDRHHIMLPKLGKVRFDGSPKVIEMLLSHNEDTRIGTVTIRRDAASEYWVSLQISSETPFKQVLPKTGRQCGIDLNLLDLVNDSDGNTTPNKRFRKVSEHRIEKQQRALSRKVEAAKRDGRTLAASRNYQKQRIKLAKTHRLIARQRDEYLNIISKHMVENQDLIAAENLKVRNLLKNHCLAKSISDAGWRTLLTLLQQKADMYGKTVILVSPQYTTQTCSYCGHVLKGEAMLPLSAREWTCPVCGTHHLRDQNAAQNILTKALIVTAETALT
ncbi:MAG: RNA-guided endonuclease TnpB family protein [Roseburia faecis]|nr:RNA-guided endonuclease TnpB family protein [Roseburia faecis]